MIYPYDCYIILFNVFIYHQMSNGLVNDENLIIHVKRAMYRKKLKNANITSAIIIAHSFFPLINNENTLRKMKIKPIRKEIFIVSKIFLINLFYKYLFPYSIIFLCIFYKNNIKNFFSLII